jgi:hypothetical protein
MSLKMGLGISDLGNQQSGFRLGKAAGYLPLRLFFFTIPAYQSGIDDAGGTVAAPPKATLRELGFSVTHVPAADASKRISSDLQE